MPVIKVQQQDFSIDLEVKALLGTCKNPGAVVTFSGLVRGNDEASQLTQMTLEHYPDMTEKALLEIASEAMKRWSLEECLVLHRFGTLQVGDQIVLVVTISQHREAAFEAASFLMDWLKTKAPFWKKEKSGDNETWVEAKAIDDKKSRDWEA